LEIQRTPEEQLRFLAGRAAEVLAQRIPNEVPPSGDFRNISVSFIVPETKNRAVLLIEHSLTGAPNQRRLLIGALREGTDYLRSNYLLHDTNEKIIQYLKRGDIVEQLVPYYKRHSDKLNEEF